MINPMMSTMHERLLTLANGRQVALLENQPAEHDQQDKPLLIMPGCFPNRWSG